MKELEATRHSTSQHFGYGRRVPLLSSAALCLTMRTSTLNHDETPKASEPIGVDGLIDDEVTILQRLANDDYLCAQRISTATGIEYRRAQLLLDRLNEKSLVDVAHIVDDTAEYHIDPNGRRILAERGLV